MKRASTEIKVRLVVLDFDCSPEEISTILGVAPDQTWRRGQTVTPEAINVHHEDGWMIRSPVEPTATTTDEAVQALFNRLPNMSAFAALPAGVEVQVTCTIFSYDERPYLWLSKHAVGSLAQIGASLDVDTYDLTEDSEESTV